MLQIRNLHATYLRFNYEWVALSWRASAFFRDNVDVFISALTILRIKSETDFVSEKRNDFYITDALKIFSVFRLHGTIFSNFVING